MIRRDSVNKSGRVQLKALPSFSLCVCVSLTRLYSYFLVSQVQLCTLRSYFHHGLTPTPYKIAPAHTHTHTKKKAKREDSLEDQRKKSFDVPFAVSQSVSLKPEQTVDSQGLVTT